MSWCTTRERRGEKAVGRWRYVRCFLWKQAAFLGELLKSCVVPMEAKTHQYCPGRWEVEKVLHSDARPPGMLWSWTMWYSCLCRCVGNSWWLRELVRAWKILYRCTIHRSPCKSRLSHTYGVVVTVELLLQAIWRTISPEHKGRNWILSKFKICLLGFPHRKGMVPS